MMLGLLLGDTGSGSVNCAEVDLENQDSIMSVYSGIKFDSDGSVYRLTSNGNYQQVGTWLLNGTNSDYYISRTIDYGTLTNDAGAGPLQMNADRAYTITQLALGTKRTDITVSISNSTTGSPVLSAKVYNLIAIRDP